MLLGLLLCGGLGVPVLCIVSCFPLSISILFPKEGETYIVYIRYSSRYDSGDVVHHIYKIIELCGLSKYIFIP